MGLDNLEQDINKVLTPGTKHALQDHQLVSSGLAIADHIEEALNKVEGKRKPTRIWATDLGKKCVRQLYYDLTNTPKEELSLGSKIKFMYGHVIEELMITLIKATGKYDVTDEQLAYQDDLNIDGWTLSGKQDVMVNGHIIDVKSAATYSYNDYVTNGVTSANDKFGYGNQLGYYHYKRYGGTNGSPIPYFLFVDKQLGNIKLVPYAVPVDYDPVDIANNLASILAPAIDKGEPPPRMLDYEVPEGKSGNMKLGTICSYCSFKNTCFPDLKTYIYSKGPVFLTKVVKEPKVNSKEEN